MPEIRLTGQGSFKRETFAESRVLRYFFQHQPGRLDRRGFRRKRGEPGRDQICVHEAGKLCLGRQERPSECCLAGSVGTGNDDDLLVRGIRFQTQEPSAPAAADGDVNGIPACSSIQASIRSCQRRSRSSGRRR